MSLRPLAGASYHTIDTVPLFTYPDVDLEATGSSDAYKHHIYTYKGRHSPLNQTPASRTSHRRGPPVLLVLLLLCCLAFVATALTGHPTNRALHLPDVLEGHGRLANNISAMLQVQPYRSMVEANYEGALEILGQKLDRPRVAGHQADLREYLRQTFPSVNFSLDWIYVGQSAVVLHWQGTDPSLKPILITNSHAMLDVRSQDRNIHSTYSASDSSSSYGEDETEYTRDVESGVGMLTAVEALVLSEYQPSRTLIFSLMLGEASDASQVSKYLHAMYEEQGLVMEFEPPVPECKRGRFEFLRVFRVLFVTVSRAISALFSVSAKPFGDDEPRMFRYTISTTSDQALHTELRMRAICAWARLILGADGN